MTHQDTDRLGQLARSQLTTSRTGQRTAVEVSWTYLKTKIAGGSVFLHIIPDSDYWQRRIQSKPTLLTAGDFWTRNKAHTTGSGEF